MMGTDPMAKGQRPGNDGRQGGVLSRFLALEPRVLLDAAAVETLDRIVDGAAADAAATVDPATTALLAGDGIIASLMSGGGGARELLFVDAGVDNYAALVAGIGIGVEVHVLQEGDWAAQVVAVLGRRDGDVSAIHIVSHGSAGQLVLGGSTVDGSSLDRYARVWSSVGQALAADGDILLYGCDVAAGDTGAAFIDALAARTGADIAASTDLSGVAGLGGNWELEHRAGDVSARSLYADGEGAGFIGLLDAWAQDTEITSGTGGVAITRTTDGKEWKFIGTPASNKVDIYVRHATNGTWGNGTTAGTPFATVTGNGSGNFGFDVAAAGNKLVASAPNYDSGSNDGRVYVYSYNGTNWTTSVETILHRTATGSGQSNYQANVDLDNGNDQFGYSVDIAWDGGTNYRLVIGNPNEDWWQYNWGTDGWGATSTSTTNARYDAGVAHVYSATSHTGTFTFQTQIESQQGGTTGNGHLFGSVVTSSYDASQAHWWIGVGGQGFDKARQYQNPGAGTIGGATFTQEFAYRGYGPNGLNADDDYMAIANDTNIQAYKLYWNGSAWRWTAVGAAFGASDGRVAVDDWDPAAAADGLGNHGARIAFSFVSGGVGQVWVADAVYNAASTGSGDIVIWGYITGASANDVAIDRTRSLDIVLAGSATGGQSWHYNWTPVAADDALTVNEDASASVNVVGNDTDTNIIYFGTLFGDVLQATASSASVYGATITFPGGQVNYNPTTSTYLQTLAVGQTAQETLTITVSDGQGGIAYTNLLVTIEGRNELPYVTGTVLSPFRVQQSGSTINYDVSMYFGDIDQGEEDLLVVEKTSGPAWVTTSGQSLVVAVPAGQAAGDYSVVIRAKDPQGGYSGTHTFVIRVDSANNAPVVANPIADQVMVADYSTRYAIPSTTFLDPDPPPGDTLTYTATLVGGGALPAWLTFNEGNRTFNAEPTAADVGTYNIRVTVNDNAAAHRGGALTTYDDFTITVVNPALGSVTQFTDGPAASAEFGFSTAISQDGNWMVVGSPGYNSNRGMVFYYQWNGAGWTYRGSVQASDGVAGEKFGWSVALDDTGTNLIVGARHDDGGAGSAYVYTRSGTAFATERILRAAVRTTNDYFGTSVAINEAGNHFLIGASHYDNGGLADSGAAFMAAVPVSAGTYTFSPNVLPKDPGASDRFGVSVAFDQNILVVGATGDDNPQGIVGLWQFADGSGATATARYAGPNGTLTSAQFAFDGQRGDVLQLSGTDGKMLLDSAVDLGASWSISTWFKDISTTLDWRTLTRGSLDHHIIINASGELGMYDNAGGTGFNGTGWNISSLSNPTGWHHIAAVGEGTRTRFYIDGVYIGSVAKKPVDDIVAVGNFQGNGQRFSSYLDDFRIYDRALTEAEIRNIAAGVGVPSEATMDAGSLYVFSTDMGNGQVAKLYVPDAGLSDFYGWTIDVDIYTYGGITRQGGVIVVGAPYNDALASDAGAVYVWRSTSLQSGTLHNDDPGNAYVGDLGNGTWTLEAKLTAFDGTAGDYFGYAVSVDRHETSDHTRLVVGAPFEDANGVYSGAVYAYSYEAGAWLPEKYVDVTPQGGSLTTASFFGSSVAVSASLTHARAVMGSRWRDTAGQVNDGASYWLDLTAGAYATMTATESVVVEPLVVEQAPAAVESPAQTETASATAGDVPVVEMVVSEPLAMEEPAALESPVQTESVAGTEALRVTDTPIVAVDDTAVVYANDSVTVDVLANDVAAVIVSLDTSSLLGTIQLNADSTLTYVAGSAFDYLQSGETAIERLIYRIRDNEGNESEATLTITVMSADDALVELIEVLGTGETASGDTGMLAGKPGTSGIPVPEEGAQDEPAGRPSLAALLQREHAKRHSGVDALLRHFGGEARRRA